jgi:hypothetical protein
VVVARLVPVARRTVGARFVELGDAGHVYIDAGSVRGPGVRSCCGKSSPKPAAEAGSADAG